MLVVFYYLLGGESSYLFAGLQNGEDVLKRTVYVAVSNTELVLGSAFNLTFESLHSTEIPA